jgi:hypothetical protein
MHLSSPPYVPHVLPISVFLTYISTNFVLGHVFWYWAASNFQWTVLRRFWHM